MVQSVHYLFFGGGGVIIVKITSKTVRMVQSFHDLFEVGDNCKDHQKNCQDGSVSLLPFVSRGLAGWFS